MFKQQMLNVEKDFLLEISLSKGNLFSPQISPDREVKREKNQTEGHSHWPVYINVTKETI